MKILSKYLFLVMLVAYFNKPLLAQNLIITTANNTSCSSPNGTVSATVDGETTDYSFQWFAGNSDTNPHLSWNSTVTNLAGGVYTVKATNNISGAVVGPVSATISNDMVVPVIAVQVQNNITCSSPYGSLKAIVSGADTDFTYAWYAGTHASGPAISVGQTINQLSAGTYTVKVTSKIFECVNIAYGTVVDERVSANISVQVLSNLTSCGTSNGSLKAIVPEAASNYAYQWFQGAVASGSVLSVSQTINNRSAGVYTVLVTHKVTSCKYVAIATVQDQRVNPVVSINTLSHVTSCTSSNGSLRAIVSGSTSNHTFKWYKGATASGTLLSTSQTFSNLSAGTYTVLVTHRITQCKTAVSAEVLDRSVILSIESVPNTVCTSANGAATVTVSGSPSDYAITWYSGTDTTGPVVGVGQSLNMVPEGTYTVIVNHNVSQCYATASVTIQDARVIPNSSIVVLSNQTSCISANGSLTAMVDGNAGDYFFEWHQGVDVYSVPAFATTQTVEQLSGGVYTVKISSNDTGCESVVSAVVSDDNVITNVLVNIVSNNTSCGLPNGSLMAMISGGLSHDYTFEWYQGVDVYSSPVISLSPYLMNMAGGIYTVKATNNISGCQSITSAMVFDEFAPVLANIQLISEQTSCTQPDGALAATVVGGPLSDYNFEWYYGPLIYSGPILSVNPTVTNLSAGVYTVLITNKITGCLTIESAMVPGTCESSFSSTEAASNESVRSVSSNVKFSFYPNPVNETLWIESPFTSGSITLLNSDGKIVRKQKLKNSETSFTFDLIDQPAGIYILVFTSGSKTSRYHVMKQ